MKVCITVLHALIARVGIHAITENQRHCKESDHVEWKPLHNWNSDKVPYVVGAVVDVDRSEGTAPGIAASDG